MKCRCADCGYLSLKKRNSIETVTADAAYRANATIPVKDGFYAFNAMPICWKGEPLGSGNEPDSNSVCHKLVISDRECQSFAKWHPGRSAERHDEMELLREVEAMNARARQEDREFAAAANARTNRLAIFAMLVAVLCAVLSATLPFCLIRN